MKLSAKQTKIAVVSHTFSNNETLRNALLEHFPNAYFNPTGEMLGERDLREFLEDSSAAIVGLEPIDSDFLDAHPQLAVISKFGVGMDNVDLDHCARRGVSVLSTPGVNALAVAELTLGFMIALARRIAISTHYLKGGRWVKNGGVQLVGKKVGLVGLGNVGKQTASILQAVGCEIMAYDIQDPSAYARSRSIRLCSFEELLQESDFVSLHVPLTPKTTHMISHPQLKVMKSSAFLINTARGGVVDESALVQALQDGMIAGAASDVFTDEPTNNTQLLGLDNFIGTAHVGGNSREAVHAVGMAAINNLLAYFERIAEPA